MAQLNEDEAKEILRERIMTALQPYHGRRIDGRSVTEIEALVMSLCRDFVREHGLDEPPQVYALARRDSPGVICIFDADKVQAAIDSEEWFDPQRRFKLSEAVFVTAVCQRDEHAECLSFICGCPCHD